MYCAKGSASLEYTKAVYIFYQANKPYKIMKIVIVLAYLYSSTVFDTAGNVFLQ